MIMDKSENENGYYIFEEKITKMIIMIDNNNFIANEKNTKKKEFQNSLTMEQKIIHFFQLYTKRTKNRKNNKTGTLNSFSLDSE